jgi:subtilisin family serine protease
VILKENVNLGDIQKVVNQDETITISCNDSDFSNFINSKHAYRFKKEFITFNAPVLKRTYSITLSENESISDFIQRDEIERIFEILEPTYLSHYPNDFIEPIYENLPNTGLDLIKAPLAWSITQGDPSIIVGVVDSQFDINHEELQDQIYLNLDDKPDGIAYHGTSVASLVAGRTNNGYGTSASIGYKTRLITADMYPTTLQRFFELSEMEEVKVLNCSWIYCSLDEAIITAINEVVYDKEILVVGAAGNGPNGNSCGNGHGYAYPASLESVISVTTVGNRYPIGHINPDLPAYRSWKDVHNFFPDDPNNTVSHTHNDKINVCAPSQYIFYATDDYGNYPSGYKLSGATSSAAPIVSGLGALIYSINPDFSAVEVKNIIESTTDDIYNIPYNETLIGQLGTGRINAYRAVLKAQCMLNPTSGIDLAMQDSNVDSFVEPNTETQQPWRSEDIWVRNQNDGVLIKEHQNPEYSPTNPNYVYVRVTNNSCEASTGTDNLKLYWAKANTALKWPLHWNGTLYEEGVLMGEPIGTLNIPPLEIGQEAILEFEWNIPNPEDYININDNPWHFCLLARIDSFNDPMTFPEEEAITQNVLNNNNIAWKNTTVVDIIPDTPSPIGGVVAVGNYFSQQKAFTLELVKENNELGKSIYEEAEVTLEMDDVLYNAWVEGGKVTQNTDSTKIANKKIITANNAVFNNIILDPNEIGTVYITFNFLTKELTNKREFIYHLIQRDAVTNEIIGGETFEVRKKPRDSFAADAGNDEEIDKNETITISAGQINEDAVYNWYDPEGNLIYTGTDLTISPDITIKYRLEITSNIDGFKDYDEVEITVNPYKLESLIPNPASNLVAINYIADGASSAYLMVVNMNTGSSDNYILDIQQSIINIDVSTYTTGLYNIILVCNGEVQNSKTLIKQ